MAQFGTFASLRAQNRDPRFARAFAYVADMLRPGSAEHARLAALGSGRSERIELGDGVFAMEQAYVPKPRSEGFFESHRQYIDVQVIVDGAEAMEVEEITRLAVTMDYDAERDLIKYATVAPLAARMALRAGDVALFWPTDGHMPSLAIDPAAPGLVRKTVVKVPAA